MRSFLLALSLCGAVLAGMPPAQAQGHKLDLARAKRLIEQHKAEQAWKLLAPHEFELAGNERYDYLLGLAALESGRPARATLAFERVLAVDPDHAGARLDMARAYYALGDYPRALAEIKIVQHLNPPLAARLTIARYLAAIDEHMHGPRVKVTGYAEGSLGYDSNVNAAPGLTSVFVPLFGVNFNLAATSVKQSASFAALGAGGQLSYPVGHDLSVLATGDLYQRANSRYSAFGYRSADFGLGVQHLSDRDRVRATLGNNDYVLDDADYRHIHSVNLDWRRQVDAHTQVGVFAQDARIRYVQEALRSNSSDMVLYGVGALHEIDAAARLIAFGSVYRGDDRATDGRIDGDRRIYGLRLGVQRALSADADAYASLTWQRSKYNKDNVIFSALRRDAEDDLLLGVAWRVTPVWTLRPEVAYTRNDSNIAIDKYDRYVVSFTLRRDWR